MVTTFNFTNTLITHTKEEEEKSNNFSIKESCLTKGFAQYLIFIMDLGTHCYSQLMLVLFKSVLNFVDLMYVNP